MILPFPVNVRFSFSCTVCGRTEVQEYASVALAPMAEPQLPDGWHLLDRKPICDKHKITLSPEHCGELWSKFVEEQWKWDKSQIQPPDATPEQSPAAPEPPALVTSETAKASFEHIQFMRGKKK